MQTKNPDLSFVEPRNLTGRRITEKMLVEMKDYQHKLINQLLYEPPKRKSGVIDNAKTARIVAEIKRVELWLKVKWNEWMHDNNRKLTA
jgi:hypothetical protein